MLLVSPAFSMRPVNINVSPSSAALHDIRKIRVKIFANVNPVFMALISIALINLFLFTGFCHLSFGKPIHFLCLSRKSAFQVTGGPPSEGAFCHHHPVDQSKCLSFLLK